MVALPRLLLLCALFAVALAAPDLVSVSRLPKWLSHHSRSLGSTLKSRLALANTASRPARVRNLVQSRKRNLLPGAPTAVPKVSVLSALITHSDAIRTKAAPRPSFREFDQSAGSHSVLQNTREQESKLAQYDGRKAAPLATVKGLGGIPRESFSVTNRGGLTGDPCRSTSDCVGDRFCVDLDVILCPGSQECNGCIPLVFISCSSSDDCSVEGEVCVEVPGQPLVCASEEAAKNDGIKIVDDVCMDARALNHLPKDQLVFSKHAVSRVLCDEYDSCATSGHMVVFRGQALRMSKYCDLVGCTEAVMEVNSPRFSRRMRIESKTEGLEYTVFAARYNTQVEESMIRLAVRFGL